MEESNVVESLVLDKSPTGIDGFDEISQGGLPCGRPTLVCGGPGCGKTMLAMEYLVRGAIQFGEPGVFVTFEESQEELIQNVASLGFNLKQLIEDNQIIVEYIAIERSEIEETGEYDLEGLFLRLALAIDSIGAKRIAIDTLEALFAGLPNESILRAELRRLFRWLKDRQMSAVITAERGERSLTRHGLEEYISDCVILLDHRVIDQVSTRRLRIVKYRGTAHDTNEFPFLIGEKGLVVMPITSAGLDHSVSNERISTGVPGLDEMFGGGGPFRGSSILLSGTAGTGKSSMAAHFVDAACRRGERCVYFSFEESPEQIIRNMNSIGLDLRTWVDQGLLLFRASRPSQQGLEMHLATMYHLIREYKPELVVIDPISDFNAVGSPKEIKATMMRLIDFMKAKHTTGVFTNLTGGGEAQEATDLGISSIIDTWLLLRDIEQNGERNRALYLLKSRGMVHSNQIREYLLTDQGIQLSPTYLGPKGVLTGSARLSQEATEREEEYQRRQELDQLQAELERKRKLLEGQIMAIQLTYEAEIAELEQRAALLQQKQKRLIEDRDEIAQSRKAAGLEE